MQVKWLRTALRNLEEQISFISEENPQAAARASARILTAVEGWKSFQSWGGTRPGIVDA